MTELNAKNIAVVWDYDGTLVDSLRKNLQVTRKILQQITGKTWEAFPVLSTVESYSRVTRSVQNWRQLYLGEYGLSEAETDLAGKLWTEYQLKDTTPTPFFPQVREVVRRLDHVPQAVFSQNSKANIAAVLRAEGMASCFQLIIGYEEVGFERQKPAPDGLVRCVDALIGDAAGQVLFVGDHAVDMLCARNANAYFQDINRPVNVLGIAALFNGWNDADAWGEGQPDYRAHKPQDVLRYVYGG